MPRATDENWYAEKRAMAYVYSLFAMHDEALLTEVREGIGRDCGVDLFVDLNESGKLMMQRRFAVQVKGYREFPSTVEINKRIAKDADHFVEKFAMPAIVCVVQFMKLAAVYCWIDEPAIEDGRAILRVPDQYDWTALNEEAVKGVLDTVAAFYDALYDVEVKKKRK